ncbi:hypothetical protein [Emcibacter sp.]|nr:hypothetical protein [Emcibacter sp.]
MLNATPLKYATGFLALAIYGLLHGMAGHDPLAFNEMLYNLGLWEYVR